MSDPELLETEAIGNAETIIVMLSEENKQPPPRDSIVALYVPD